MTRLDGLPYDLDSPVYSKTLSKGKRLKMMLVAELLFTALTFLLGTVEYFLFEEVVTAYILFTMSLTFFGMWITFFYGFRYNCYDLLIGHSAEAGFLALLLFIMMALSFLYITPEMAIGLRFRMSMRIVYATVICFVVLLISFGSASYARAKEIIAFERSRREHFKKLLIKTIDVVQNMPKPVEDEDD